MEKINRKIELTYNGNLLITYTVEGKTHLETITNWQDKGQLLKNELLHFANLAAFKDLKPEFTLWTKEEINKHFNLK